MEYGGARGWSGIGLLVVTAWLASACSSEKPGEKRQWVCFEGDACRCHVRAPHTVYGSSDPEVALCSIDGCCLLTARSLTDTEATCECIVSDDCAAEASSRPDVEIVSQCPPPGEAPKSTPGKCAAEGQNCRQDYLAQNDLTGCCDGSLCKANASGVPVCQSGTEEELAFFAQCEQAQRSEERDTLELVSGALSTSVGEIVLENDVHYTSVDIGPGGCVNGASVTIGASSTCELAMDVALSDGVLAITRVSGNFSGCEGASSEASYLLSGSGSFGDLTVRTVACDANLIFEAYCVGGRFDFHLDGVIGSVTFDDVHVVLEGGRCGSSPKANAPRRERQRLTIDVCHSARDRNSKEVTSVLET